MRLHSIAVIILSIVLTAGCSNNTGSSDKGIIHLQAQKVVLPFELMAPFGLSLIDSFLVVGEKNEDQSKLLMLLNLQTKQRTFFGLKGEGPGEILSAWDLFAEGTTKNIALYDLGKFQYNLFPLDSVLKNSNYKPRQISFKNRTNGRLLYVRAVDAQTFVASGLFNKGLLGIINLADSSQITVGAFPQKFSAFKAELLNQAYHYIITFNPQLKRVALCAQFSDRFLLFDSLYNQISDHSIGSGFDPIFNVSTHNDFQSANLSPHSRFGHWIISSTSKYIYALYSGKTMVESNLSAGFLELEVIHVMDWEGKLVKTLLLDMPIISFTVDEKDREIYAISIRDQAPQLLRFKL